MDQCPDRCDYPAISFEEWQNTLDKLMVSRYGISIHNLPDFDYQGAYVSRESYTKTIEALLEWVEDF